MTGTKTVIFAPAKINLTLHVTGRRDDGYHLLDSLVVFASVGDRLTLRVGQEVSLTVRGPEAEGLRGQGNLILDVAGLFKDMPGAAFRLTKNLPVSSGIGGGSADAAAAFRGLMAHLSGGEIDAQMYDPVHTPFGPHLMALGADIPVCLQSRPARMRGAGERLSRLPPLPTLYALLINPRVAVPTPQVFAALERRDNPPMPGTIPAFAGLHEFIWWLRDQRNDLQKPAMSLAPVIGDVLEVLDREPDCLLARMSGSGATCFGLFDGQDAATAALGRIAADHPGWWVKPARLGAMSRASLPRFTREE